MQVDFYNITSGPTQGLVVYVDISYLDILVKLVLEIWYGEKWFRDFEILQFDRDHLKLFSLNNKMNESENDKSVGNVWSQSVQAICGDHDVGCL